MKQHCQTRNSWGKRSTDVLSLIVLHIFLISNAYASSCGDYAATPPFLTTTVKPNVLFMLDNSGSMKEPVYPGSLRSDCGTASTGYNPNKEYYGLFDASRNYRYDSSVPVDPSPYDGSADAPYKITDASGNILIDTSMKGAFVEDSSCTPNVGVNCWNGNFLNWMTTRRMDAARKVLVGGKVENRLGYDYMGNGSKTWKIVGNNERDDRSICRAYSASQSLSPYPNNTKFHLYSPADAGAVKSLYDPYAKLEPVGISDIITDKSGKVIGEFGSVTNLSHVQQTVIFKHAYLHPIIVAKPPSINGSDPSTVRVQYDPATKTLFKVQIIEWPYNSNTDHTSTEDLAYMVIEQGTHTLSGTGGDLTLVAGSTALTENVNSWKNISGLGLSTTPVVIASVTSKYDPTAVTTRIKDIDKDSFKIALQRQEATTTPHLEETVHFIAMEPGTTTGSVTIKAGSDTDYDENYKTLSFGDFSATAFVADMQTTNDTDPVNLRYRNFNRNAVEIMLEEDKSNDSEVDHNFETVGYIAFSPVRYNVAVIVNSEPKGLVQDIDKKVRTGISFYRYQRDNDIYTNEWAHGGTLRLPIPKNPFVKDDSDIGGYRYLDTPIKAKIADIIDSIEHYPLVWGTTPLAENLVEVGKYFSQTTPYYDDKPTIPATASETDFLINDTWDPYTYDIEGSWQKVRCAKSFVIIFTDGEPYRDDYIPAEYVNYDGESNNSKDCRKTGNTDNSCTDNLDDVARYLYWDKAKNNYRDLRSNDAVGQTDEDLTGDQHLEIFTVAFGSNTIPKILQDTANNANGVAYAAEDGEQLGAALTSAITSILKRTSAGSSLSVLSERATSGSLINQALFFPQKTFSTGGNSYDVSWTGAVNAYWFYNSRTVSNIRENTVDPFYGNYALDVFEDRVLDFIIDSQGSLKIDYYKAIKEGTSNDGALNPNSAVGDTAGPEGTYQNIDEVKKIFEVGEILKDRVVDANPPDTQPGRRHIYAINENNVMDDEFVQAKYSRFDDLFNLVSSDIPQCLGTVDTPAYKDAAAKNLMSYIRGASDNFTTQANINQQCRSRKVDDNGKLWKLGDIIYSTPRVVDYVHNTDKFSLLFTGANDGMLHAFKLGKLRKDQAGTDQAVALCDSNIGSCTHSEIGDEAWTFIPKNAMPYLKYLADPDYKHIYTIDLPPYTFKAGGKQILIGGMRFGGATGCTTGGHWCGDTNGDGVIDLDADGIPIQAVPPGASPATIGSSSLGLSSYFALDITNPYEPKFLWEFSDPDMGYSYSGPALITRGGQKYVMFLSGPLSNKGGAANGQDLKIYFLKLDPNDFTLSQTFKIDGNGEAGFVRESALANLNSAFGGRLFTEGIDSNLDGNTDAVFFGVNWRPSTDWEGNVFFVAPTNDDPIDSTNQIMWELGSVFDSSQTPITAKIEHGVCYDNNYIYFGSGRWFYKQDTPGNINDTNSLWGIEIDRCLAELTDGDPMTTCSSILHGAHNGLIGDDHCNGGAGGTVKATGDISWQETGLEANLGGDYFMERNITDPTFSPEIVAFTTMEPSSDLCGFGGRTRVWSFNCRTGHNIFSGCSNASSDPPLATMLLQLSGGNIEDTAIIKDSFDPLNDHKTTKWFTGVPPESSTPIIPYAGKLNGEIILWIER